MSIWNYKGVLSLVSCSAAIFNPKTDKGIYSSNIPRNCFAFSGAFA